MNDFRTQGEAVVTALQKRHFDAYYCDTAEQAKALALSLIPKGSSVTWGGSMTIRDMGLCDALKAGDYRVYDRDLVAPAERGAYVKEHFFSDWYLMSSNALSADGELVNLDGNGNRVASLIFGPANVLVMVGKNKIMPTLQDAVTRVRTVAAPKNAQRFPIQTPCKKTGNCANCQSPDSICCSMVYTRLCRPAGRIKVIVVGEDLGY